MVLIADYKNKWRKSNQVTTTWFIVTSSFTLLSDNSRRTLVCRLSPFPFRMTSCARGFRLKSVHKKMHWKAQKIIDLLKFNGEVINNKKKTISNIQRFSLSQSNYCIQVHLSKFYWHKVKGLDLFLKKMKI